MMESKEEEEEEEENSNMERVFYSSYSSFQLQLRGKYFVLNCDSGFHRLIKLMVEEGGCALVNDPTVICL